MKVVNQIKAILAERQLTQADLAELTGLSQQVVRRLCRIETNPSLLMALKVSSALEVPLDVLYSLRHSEVQKRTTRPFPSMVGA